MDGSNDPIDESMNRCFIVSTTTTQYNNKQTNQHPSHVPSTIGNEVVLRSDWKSRFVCRIVRRTDLCLESVQIVAVTVISTHGLLVGPHHCLGLCTTIPSLSPSYHYNYYPFWQYQCETQYQEQ
jgi:hypothetical protein